MRYKLLDWEEHKKKYPHVVITKEQVIKMYEEIMKDEFIQSFMFALGRIKDEI